MKSFIMVQVAMTSDSVWCQTHENNTLFIVMRNKVLAYKRKNIYNKFHLPHPNCSVVCSIVAYGSCINVIFPIIYFIPFLLYSFIWGEVGGGGLCLTKQWCYVFWLEQTIYMLAHMIFNVYLYGNMRMMTTMRNKEEEETNDETN